MHKSNESQNSKSIMHMSVLCDIVIGCEQFVTPHARARGKVIGFVGLSVVVMKIT